MAAAINKNVRNWLNDYAGRNVQVSVNVGEDDYGNPGRTMSSPDSARIITPDVNPCFGHRRFALQA
jgi:hypothetical protein